jgi:site-specific DNA recombinase
VTKSRPPSARAPGSAKKLEIVPKEAETVRTIFSLYLELGSMGALITEFDRRGIRTKVNRRRDGQKSGGIRFGVGPLAHLLKNRFYIGEVAYRGEVYRGEHDPILTRDVRGGAGKTRRQRHCPAGRYYVSQAILQNRKAEAGSITRVPVPEIETLVRDGVRRHLAAMGGTESHGHFCEPPADRTPCRARDRQALPHSHQLGIGSS